MSLAFHPEQPGLLAAGGFNGEVYLWDFGREDTPLIATGPARVNEYLHREQINKIVWVKDQQTNVYQLLTVSNDGRILLWSLANQLAFPVAGFLVVPDADKPSSVSGGTSIGVGRRDWTTFVVGTEVGQVLRCSAMSLSVPSSLGAAWKPDAVKLLSWLPERSAFDVKTQVEQHARMHKLPGISLQTVYAARPELIKVFPSPVNFAFESHSGAVHSLDSSPSLHNFFLSCSTDGSIRVYNMLQRRSICALRPTLSEYMLCGGWSPIRPCVLAAGSSNGILYIYDLEKSPLHPVVSECVSEGALYGLSFNPKVQQLLATGDSEGVVRVWQMSESLWRLQPRESGLMELQQELEVVETRMGNIRMRLDALKQKSQLSQADREEARDLETQRLALEEQLSRLTKLVEARFLEVLHSGGDGVV
eukprot:gnl/Hemi2/22468_TR7486_c0_g1_i1.p1 gnl/Hemi2/22468_TR7486_c0_g1~~gnl/Hemi2/22468_TR7486_c0_g1_i1.p1  ORF type:complete len:419 (-),score=2.19 gnl/Hemi2/22468_TR7486_c0_g1_i1:44-1300(-)